MMHEAHDKMYKQLKAVTKEDKERLDKAFKMGYLYACNGDI